ncbi:MAG TPA: hypothetical protein VI643_08385 [Planctomycetota bacterium]|nr:hypothetical protein [Planctomycetota bacterium]
MGAWAPDGSRLTTSGQEVANEYRTRAPDADLNAQLQSVLSKKDFFGAGSEAGKTGKAREVMRTTVETMLRRIDEEHPTLLVPEPKSASSLSPDPYRLPTLVSSVLPVGVAVTSASGASPEGKDGIPSQYLGEGPKPTREQQVQAEIARANFQQTQTVTLGISTVLNSPSVFDRIEYVSTYIYFYPYPNPPNGDVVLEKEFWRRFYAFHAVRPNADDEIRGLDLARALAGMRIQIRDVKTTVELKDLVFGELSQDTEDKSGFSLGAKAPAHPEIEGADAKLEFGRNVKTNLKMKLAQQLDQRSTYISSARNFLRVTQRGMLTVNLSGRIRETMFLDVPIAHETIRVLVPHKDGFMVRELAQPLYTRLDAITVSVVVARQATRLASNTADTYRTDDPKDATFVAGVTNPYRFTLWQWDRELSELTRSDLLGDACDAPHDGLFFVEEGRIERPSPMLVLGFSPEELSTLMQLMRKRLAVAGGGAFAMEEGETRRKYLIGVKAAKNVVEGIGLK